MDRVDQAIKAIKLGKMVIVADDDDRECEGDLIMAASLVTAEDVNMMARWGRGLICCAIHGDMATRLGLHVQTGALHATAFTESVDLKCGITTGISCQDRAMGLQRLACESSQPSDFVSPGHLFPLVAHVQGVLGRRGHTEASVDLCRLAGLPQAGVLCEIMNEDGTMARGKQLQELAHAWDLPFITVEELVQWRKKNESLCIPSAAVEIPTPWGIFSFCTFESPGTCENYPIMVWSHKLIPNSGQVPLVRVHSECATGDLFSSLRCDCGSQLHESMDRIARSGCGVLIYLRQEGRGIGIKEKIKAYALQDQGMNTFEANLALGHAEDSRDYWEAAQILRFWGIDEIRLLSGNPIKKKQLIHYGIKIQKVEDLSMVPNIHNEKYLKDKGENYARM